MSEFLKEDEWEESSSFRASNNWKQEQVKYVKSKLLDKLLDEESNPVMESINLHYKEDKRFTKETNGAIKQEVYKRIHQLKYLIYSKMARKMKSTYLPFLPPTYLTEGRITVLIILLECLSCICLVSIINYAIIIIIIIIYYIYVVCLSNILELNEKGVFDEEANHIRMRSLFKVELQRYSTIASIRTTLFFQWIVLLCRRWDMINV